MIIPLLKTHGGNTMETFKDITIFPGGAIFVLIIVPLGAGLLAFPYAFWSSGETAVGLYFRW